MGNLSLHQNGVVGNTSPATGDHTPDHVNTTTDGYASEDFVPGSSSSRDRKKGLFINYFIIWVYSILGFIIIFYIVIYI